mgnify:CR=1 FL=1
MSLFLGDNWFVIGKWAPAILYGTEINHSLLLLGTCISIQGRPALKEIPLPCNLFHINVVPYLVSAIMGLTFLPCDYLKKKLAFEWVRIFVLRLTIVIKCLNWVLPQAEIDTCRKSRIAYRDNQDNSSALRHIWLIPAFACHVGKGLSPWRT